jgi:septal ring factor EnvC (AmiA/AmiB activator)
MRTRNRHSRWFLLLAAALLAALIGTLSTGGSARAGSQSLSQLNSQLGVNQSTQSNLAADISGLNSEISTLDRQIALVHGREQTVRDQLNADAALLAGTQGKLSAETSKLARLRRALAHAQRILSAQLLSSYEQPRQSLVTVVLNANGFRQMLDQLQFLKSAEVSQQQIIAFTARVKRATTRSARQLMRLQAQQRTMTATAETQLSAVAQMNGLLTSRQASVANLEAARRTALANARAQGSRLSAAIDAIRAEQAAAARRAAAEAAAAAAAATNAAPAPASSPAASAGSSRVVASGGWAIPASVVICESGGQNLPPNSAGASGYYQILPSTWTGEGGTGPAAYLAPKSEQDAIAAKLWDGGAGARNWVCASIVGII